MQTVAFVADNGAKRVKPTYTDEFRSMCVLMLEAAGYPDTPGALERTARTVEVPAMTISRWFKAEQNPPPNRIVAGQKRNLTAMLQEAAELHAGRISDPSVAEGTSARDSAVVMGIAIDKMYKLNELSDERLVGVRRLITAISLAGYDVDATLAKMSSRLEAIAEQRDNGTLTLPADNV